MESYQVWRWDPYNHGNSKLTYDCRLYGELDTKFPFFSYNHTPLIMTHAKDIGISVCMFIGCVPVDWDSSRLIEFIWDILGILIRDCVRIVKPRAYTAAFFFKCRLGSVGALLSLSQRILFDTEGIWYAHNTKDQQYLYAKYGPKVRRMKNVTHRLINVEFAKNFF